MHTLTLVLLPRGTVNLWDAGSAMLLPHQLSNDHRYPAARLDYWTVGGGHLDDQQSAAILGLADDAEMAKNVCFVSRLPTEFIPAAVVTPDGKWHDVEDFGWGMLDASGNLAGNSPDNLDAEARWTQEVRKIFAAHSDYIAVEFDTHS